MSGFPPVVYEGIDSKDNPYVVSFNGLTAPGNYVLQGRTLDVSGISRGKKYTFQPGDTVKIDDQWYYRKVWWADAVGPTPGRIFTLTTPSGNECELFSYTLNVKRLSVQAVLTVTQKNSKNEDKSGCFDKSGPINILVSGVQFTDGSPYTENLKLVFNGVGGQTKPTFKMDGPKDKSSYSLPASSIPAKAGGRDLVVKVVIPGHPLAPLDEKTFPINDACTDEERDQKFPGVEAFNVCRQVANDTDSGKVQYAACVACVGPDNERLWTAVGCIDNSAQGIVGKLIGTGIGIAGGIALLMIIASGFELTISQGEPKRVSDAKERLTSAIIGLLFIIFSVTILQFIGVTILQIPGFGSP